MRNTDVFHSVGEKPLPYMLYVNLPKKEIYCVNTHYIARIKTMSMLIFFLFYKYKK